MPTVAKILLYALQAVAGGLVLFAAALVLRFDNPQLTAIPIAFAAVAFIAQSVRLQLRERNKLDEL